MRQRATERKSGKERRVVLHTLSWEAAEVGRSVRRAFTVAGSERNTAVQSLKAAAAALLAWVVAGWWWEAPMALMAPWTALFLMHNTVYRSLLSALQQFVVVLTGTLLAAGAGVLTHNELAAMALALPVTVLLGNYARFGSNGLYAPTAALFVLVYGTYTGADILHRLLETLLGAVIGVGVNALVFPPVHTRRVTQLREQLPRSCGDLLHHVADELATDHDQEQARRWYESAQRLTDVVTELREARRWSAESYRINPARRLRRVPPEPPAAWDFVWDQVTEHTARTMRTLTEAAVRPPLPSEARDALAALLRAAGDACLLDDHLREDGRRDDAGTDEARRALARASAAHRRLTTAARAGRGFTSTTGGVLADTRRLLSALLRVADPDAAFDPEAPAHPGARQPADR
ncbi:FUSC family protein [Streptomyces sp. NPDC054842]